MEQKHYLTNKEFQEILAQYPDDYIVCMDNVFGWEKIHNMISPELYVNTDIGQIEIEPDEFRDIWVDPVKRLPENGQRCVIFDKTENEREYQFKIANYNDDIKRFTYCYNSIFIPIENVSAWMEIPECDFIA